jgi:hypothetical protein
LLAIGAAPGLGDGCAVGPQARTTFTLDDRGGNLGEIQVSRVGRRHQRGRRGRWRRGLDTVEKLRESGKTTLVKAPAHPIG